MRAAVTNIETRKVRGKVQARCKRGEWKALTDENWYRHEGQELPYITLCKEHERERSAEWHRAKRAKSKRAAPAKSGAKKTTAKRSIAKPNARKVGA